MLLRSTKRPRDGKAVWQKCEARGCLHCGPALRERDLAHDVANLSKHQVLRRVVAASAWNRLRAKLKRAGSGWVAYPQPGGMLAVYAHAGMTGALVSCLPDELASDYAGIGPNERIRRPRAWALHTAAGGGSTPAWEPLGASTVTDRAPDLLRKLGVYRGEVDEVAVPLSAWEVHDFTVPEGQAYRQLVAAFELQEGRARPLVRRRAAA